MQARAAVLTAALAVFLTAAPALQAQDAGTPMTVDMSGQPDRNARAIQPMVVDAPASPAANGMLPVITLDQDALYLNSKWGQRVQADLERQGRDIAAENDRLEKQFADEERELTQLRATLPPDEFRKRADAFDTRVVEVRRERANAAREWQTRANEERSAFFRAALPILAAMMRERGAVAVLDRNSVFVAAESIDVTEALIQRLDSEIGGGPVLPPAGQEAAPPVPETVPEIAPETVPTPQGGN
ncbi:OmpH family outer membrane protein [Paracoccus lutimaris]|uniref:Skp family chaperone for outer membrane proteins n=1 Tax=Paracoccus lutimaris TaxID=1490030 RepID=A0A368YM71_9RHOB|nr:OmpH family outer membrane protein [Paracoccus lutimaris]RCW81332.1 Skp family chaperone for outer membrane proteins [Paracoccus lutimaris]